MQKTEEPAGPELEAVTGFIQLKRKDEMRDAGMLWAGSKKSPKPKSSVSPIVHVPEDCPTIEEAIARVDGNPKLTTVQVAEGNYYPTTEQDYIVLEHAIEIRGAGMGATVLHGITIVLGRWGAKVRRYDDPSIIVIADITFNGEGGKHDGIYTKNNSIPLRVERCAFLNIDRGIHASEPAWVVSCVIRGCKRDAVGAFNNTTVTLSGEGTEISDCDFGKLPPARCRPWGTYALNAMRERSIIKIVEPLSIEIVSGTKADGTKADLNFGGYGRIEIVDEQGNTVQVVSEGKPEPVVERRTQWDRH